MLKKVAAILLPILLLAVGCYFYFHLKKEEAPKNAAIKAIPIDASFILESRKTLPLWKTVIETNDIWTELLEAPFFAELNKQANTLDSIVREDPDLETNLENEPLFISAHTNGMNKFNYLFVFSVPELNSQLNISNYLGSLKNNSTANNLQYEESTIHSIKIDEKNAFYYIIKNGIFISSCSPALIEESLRQLDAGISLMNNVYFTKVLNASSHQVPVNLFINFQTFANVSSGLFNRDFLPTLISLEYLGQWTGLDVTINPDEFIMTGFTNCDSTGGQFLNLFQHQSLHEVKVTSVVPANTAFMVCHEFSDYGEFHKDYLQYLDRHNKNRNRAEWIDRINQNYDLNIEKYFYPWINNEVAQIITEPSDSTLENDTYVLIGANDIANAVARLSTLADSIAAKKRITATDTSYMHHGVYNLTIDNVTSNILGSSFSGVTKSWFTSAGNYVVFANTLNGLKTFIYEYEEKKTLENDSYYKDYVKQHVESESGIYIYNNMSLSPVLYSKYLDKSYVTDIKKYKNIFSEFHAASVQFSYLQGMFYTSLYFKRTSLSHKEITPTWQVGLDTTLATRPWWVTDHISHQQFVLVEDENESVYLINTAGQIEWKKKVDGYMQSSVFQIDALKNHKIQYLFNTTGNIDILDRKGNNLDGFPIKLKYPSTAPLQVLDYDNARNYKLVLPCKDLKIYEYDIKGKQVTGWSIPETETIVKCPSHYLVVNKKDYIIFIDNAGKVYALDRKGKEKLNLDNRMPSHLKNFYTIQGKSLTDSYIIAADSLGTVFKLSLSGELSTIQYLKTPKTNTRFMLGPRDSTDKYEMFFLNGNDLWAYNTDKTERFHAKVKDKPDDNLLLFVYPDHSVKIGLADPKNERIYLWDSSGKLYPEFPLHGSKDFGIADMKNDGILYLATGVNNKVFIYALQ